MLQSVAAKHAKHDMTNATEADLREYLTVFNETLIDTSRAHLEPEVASQLIHISLLPSLIRAYVSTTHGIAIEWVKTTDTTTIETIRSSKRVEALFFGVSGNSDHMPAGFCFEDSCIHLYHARTDAPLPIRLLGNKSSVRLEWFAHEGGREPRYIRYAEFYSDRTLSRWNREAATIRAKDIVLSALTEVRKAMEAKLSLTNYVNQVKSKTVLLLGDYGREGMVRFDTLKHTLTELGYNPVAVSEVPDFDSSSLSQKVVLLASLSRFVVVDDSTKSGQLTEIEICRRNDFLTVLLRLDNKPSTFMTAGSSVTSKVMLEFPYTMGSIRKDVEVAAAKAEETILALKRSYDELYPWRS